MRKLCLWVIFSFTFAFVWGQNITISGYLYERGSMESLPGGLVYEPVTQIATTTNTYGFYTITLPYRDSMYLVFNSFGYINDTIRVQRNANIEYDAYLSKVTMLEAVNIVSEKQNTEQVQMSAVKITPQEVKSVPMLLGEKDVFKTLLLLPGVQSASEGTSGIYVRGGGPDQNLIILDEATIYNANHLLGFFSIFNGDAVKSIELVKGGFPARYGGRLSSVIDVTMKDGNKDSYHGEGGIGVISSHAMVEGPIVKNKASFMISARTTYLDLLTRPIMMIAKMGGSVGYYFYDLNAKFNYSISNKDKIYLSAYFGRDKFYLTEKSRDEEEYEKMRMGLYWQNATATVRWNHLFTNKIFSNLSFIFSDYKMDIYTKQTLKEQLMGQWQKYSYSMDFNSGIRDYTLKYDVSFIPNASHHIRVGAMTTYHEARPNALMFTEDTLQRRRIEKEKGLEYAVYAEDEINIRNKFRINPGIRLVGFSVPGKTYFSPEPRLAMSYNILKNLSVKASYAMMSQSMILLTTSTIGLPTDLWVPVTDQVKPQRSQQVAAGIHYDLKKPRLSFSLEGYYKKMDNILAYKEGSSYFMSMIEGIVDEDLGSVPFSNRWSSNTTVGQGWSYGMEFLCRKEVGKFTGWVGYTLSWTQQQFDELNFGKPFFARYDRRHDLSIVLMYRPNAFINVSLAWTYATGNAVTLPTTLYISEDIEEQFNTLVSEHYDPTDRYADFIENYGDKNNLRMRPFHHLDVGVQFTKYHKKNWQSIFEVSIYNVYNHKNPFFYYVETEYDEATGNSYQVIKQVSIFPLIPSFTYHFKF